MRLEGKKIAIFSHDQEGTTGLDDEIVSFIRKKDVRSIINIKFPFIESSDGAIRIKKIDAKGKEQQLRSRIKFYKPEPISYGKDLIWGFFYGLFHLKKTDIFFGMNNLLALIGIWLKFFGVVKTVVYYIIDFTPRRYQNNFLNRLYYAIDTFVLYHSDLVVPLNKEMLDGRVKQNKLDISKITYHIAPFGNDSDTLEEKDYTHDKNILVYFGRITKNKGSELFVPIMRELLHQGRKNFKFIVIGGGDISYLQGEIRKYSLEDYFELKGRIENQADIDKILCTCGIAIAPYFPEDTNNFSYYSDPGKVKIYLGCGLPIVITDVPPIAKTLASQKSGLITKYDGKAFADTILKIYNSYTEYEKNAILVGKNFSWRKIFEQLFSTIV